MGNSWKNYRFGFDVGAAVLFAVIMLPKALSVTATRRNVAG